MTQNDDKDDRTTVAPTLLMAMRRIRTSPAARRRRTKRATPAMQTSTPAR